ncbi:MAG TPA: hypothetical protein VFE17_08445 [Candidatus Baltobacteraceae bacterium]|jgi:8-oxo-dGTP pyrophosphatase MutT (NUDIX family)|nr:hypothetical protein [Candidatus Baltobacteraceae bacterium]
MLVRPTAGTGFQVLMLRRSEHSHFVPDAYVFPGGAVEAEDMSERAFARARGIDAHALAVQFRAKPAPALALDVPMPGEREAAGLLVAAVRELFEEAGVFLACDADGDTLPQRLLQSRDGRLGELRAALHERQLPFTQILEDLEVYADARSLVLFSQWITPPVFPRRYNAHFFLALARADQDASADAHETHDSLWIEPARALQECRLGKLRMVYPTIKHLERLAQFESAAQLLEFARTKTIYSIMPQTTGERTFSLPSNLEFAW